MTSAEIAVIIDNRYDYTKLNRDIGNIIGIPTSMIPILIGVGAIGVVAVIAAVAGNNDTVQVDSGNYRSSYLKEAQYGNYRR
jgi:hypothetical protein